MSVGQNAGRSGALKGAEVQPRKSNSELTWGTDPVTETFQDGDNGETFWVPTERVENLADAIAEVASFVGPFDSHVYAERAIGIVTLTSEGWKFSLDNDGTFEVWQVVAV